MAFQPRLNKFWGWGTPTEGVTAEERSLVGMLARHRFDVLESPVPPVSGRDIILSAPRVAVPEALAAIFSEHREDRLAHASGKSFPDLARARRGQIEHAPDLVAYPATERDVTATLDWASDVGVAVVPYGGGSSVVGGVTPAVDEAFAAVISLDLQRMDRVVEVDPVSLTARVQAGVLGPSLAEQLAGSSLVLRHYPQSYQHSSLGGWIATRAGGHYATLHTHIDDFVESVRMVTPAGALETRRLPSSGAGPDPNRLVIGSEGALGVITESWIRLQRRPTFRAGAVVRFRSFADAVGAVRSIAQSGLHPANLRLLDRVEAMNSLVADGTVDVLVLGFESADHDVRPQLDRASECCRDHGGTVDVDPPAPEAARGSDAAQAWRSSFIRMPHLRDELLGYGIISETFETAVTWDRFETLHAKVTGAVRQALAEAGLAPCSVSCRFTHVYADGVAPYFTVLAKGRGPDLDRQWWDIKQAASDAIIDAGGTITHHHAVGRDHMPWYRRERADMFGAALAGARTALDPAGIMNPGVLLP